MKNNCRITHKKDVVIEDKILDIITIDAIDNDSWAEVTLAFTREERSEKPYTGWINLANNANKLKNKDI